jgi:hypothetical protein
MSNDDKFVSVNHDRIHRRTILSIVFVGLLATVLSALWALWAGVESIVFGLIAWIAGLLVASAAVVWAFPTEKRQLHSHPSQPIQHSVTPKLELRLEKFTRGIHPRIATEEIGDAFEKLALLRANGASPRELRWFVVRSVLWAWIHSVPEYIRSRKVMSYRK